MTTSEQLQSIEKNLAKIIKDEVQQAEGRLKTIVQDELQQTEDRLEKSLVAKFSKASKDLNQQLKFQTKILEKSFDKKFDEKQQVLRNDILDFKDEIITEVKDLRQETTVNSGRITKLEKIVLSN